MKKMIIACLLCMFAVVHTMASDNLKVWMNNPVMVADGKTVTYLTIYQTDEEDEYWNFEVHISLPEGIHIAQRKEGRKMVDDVTLNADRFEGMPHTIGVSMPDATSFVAICTNTASKDPYYNDDADGNLVEELFTVGLIADEVMANGTYDIEVEVAKFARPDVTGHTLTNCALSKMTVTGGQSGDESTVSYTLSSAGYGTIILPFDAELPEGVRAFVCTALDGNTVVTEEQTHIVANTPMLLQGVLGNYNFVGAGSADEDSYTEGLLTGVYPATTISSGYVLQTQQGVTGFYAVDSTSPKTVPANRCYLSVPSDVKCFTLDLDIVDGIDKLTIDVNDSNLYDLTGRIASKKSTGIIIKNGRKEIR